MAESCSSSFNYPEIINVSSHSYTRKELLLSNVVEVYVFMMGKSSELVLFPIKAWLPNPKTCSIRGCLSTSRSERSERMAYPQQ